LLDHSFDLRTTTPTTPEHLFTMSFEDDLTLLALKDNCAMLTKKLQQIHGEIRPNDQPALPVKLKALQEKERSYEAEIAQLRQQSTEQIDENSWNYDLVRLRVYTELTSLLGHMAECSAEIKTMVEQADQELKREKEILEEHTKINELLKWKKQEQSTPSEMNSNEKSEVLSQSIHSTTYKLKNFLDNNYPIPSADSGASKKRKKDTGYEDFSTTNGNSLMFLLQSLISTYSTKPTDPYVSTKGYWRPYVELLVAAGVAEAHKKDHTLVRLVDFE